MTRAQRALAYLLMVGGGLLAPLLLLEVVFRLLPTSDITDTQPVTALDPFIHLRPNQDVTLSKGWHFKISARKHINNYGYMDDDDFDPGGTSPLVVVIGDSYIQAPQVSNSEAFHGHLANRMRPKGRVYAIGFSGSQLSQYLAFADFARDTFRPDGMVIVVIANDFDESTLAYKRGSGMGLGFHYFDPADTLPKLHLVDFPGHGGLLRVARHSALVRYFVKTVGIDWDRLSCWRGCGAAAREGFVGNVRADTNSARMAASHYVIDAFFQLLPESSGLPPDRVLFVLDGIRPNLYSDSGLTAAAGSYVDQMRRAFMSRAAEIGYEVIDMQSIFQRHHRATGERFEWTIDAHWDATGHALVADTVAASRLFREVFEAN